ncbi:hypothetical protein [Flavobacterium mesophilum]|uniref:hypothetical protein n=1 Tax=Flavobacterium mesophilum TaxID=3143495 RepID=UPI0031DE0C7B
MKRLLIFFILFNVSIYSLYSQNKTIKGRVISNDMETMSFVSIMINDTIKVGQTDLNGYFKIEIPISEQKIVFIDIGLEKTPIKLEDKCDNVELVMLLAGTNDFMTFKKIDRLRMKEFKKLPELHKEAFNKGLFLTDKVCYTIEFIPHAKKSSI